MVMVIECQACQSRFRLAKSLFKESKAIRVRCRKCGGFIVVENPELTDAGPEDEPLPAAPAVERKAEDPREEALRIPEEPIPDEPIQGTPRMSDERAMADLLREIEAEPERRFPEPSLPPPDVPFQPPDPVSPYPDSPDGSEALASALEDLFKPHPPSSSDPGPIPGAFSSTEPSRVADEGIPPARKESSRGRSERPPYTRPLFIVIAILWVLTLIVAALLYGNGHLDQWFAGKQSPTPAVASTKKAPPKPTTEITNVTWYTDNAYDGGTLFAVTGTVTNTGEALSEGIRIRAILVGKDNTVLSEKVVIAGNRIDNTMLRHTKQEVIESFLAREAEEGSVSRNVPNGESLPFMAVFFDPPKKIESVDVRAIPAEGK